MKRLGLLGIMLLACWCGCGNGLRAQDTVRMTGVQTLYLDWRTAGNDEALIADIGNARQTIHPRTKYEFDDTVSLSLYCPTSLLSLKTSQYSNISRLLSLDVSGCHELDSLDCSHNNLVSLYLYWGWDPNPVSTSHNGYLTYLDCSDNALTWLELRYYTALKYLDCSYNNLTSLMLWYDLALESVKCEGNCRAGLLERRKNGYFDLRSLRNDEWGEFNWDFNSYDWRGGEQNGYSLTYYGGDGGMVTYKLHTSGTADSTFELEFSLRIKEDNANLRQLRVTSKEPYVSRSWNNVTSDVSTTVPYGCESIVVDASVEHEYAKILSGLGDHQLVEGDNDIEIEVEAEDGSRKIYTLVIRRQSADAVLQSLTLSDGMLEPAFSSDAYNYNVEVLYETDSLEIFAVARHDSATVSGAGKYGLQVGDNVIKVTVNSEDGSAQQIYTLTVRRIDAALKSLTISAGTLKPAFASEVYKYNVEVSYETDSLEVFAEARDESATVSGVGKYGLQVGDNHIEIVVTAEGISQQTYTLTVTRKARFSSDAALQSLTISAGTLEPAFASEVYKYNVEVSYETDSLEVFAAARDENATVSGVGKYGLQVGDNHIEVVVTAEDGSQQTYTLTVTRKRLLSSDAALQSLTVSDGTLEPAFSPENPYYNVEVPYETDSLEVFAAARHDSATVSGMGKYGLQVGEKDIKIEVTAEDSRTRQVYWLKVMRRERVKSSDATLSSLRVSSGTLTPAFSPTVFNYRVEVPNTTNYVEVVAKANDPNATLSGAGAYGLRDGSSTYIKIVVTAEDGTQRTYALVVYREKPKDPTAVEAVSGRPDVQVYAQDGAIHLSKAIGELSVYTATGLCVYIGQAVVIPVPQPGLYIVRSLSGGYSWKVVVR